MALVVRVATRRCLSSARSARAAAVAPSLSSGKPLGFFFGTPNARRRSATQRVDALDGTLAVFLAEENERRAEGHTIDDTLRSLGGNYRGLGPPYLSTLVREYLSGCAPREPHHGWPRKWPTASATEAAQTASEACTEANAEDNDPVSDATDLAGTAHSPAVPTKRIGELLSAVARLRCAEVPHVDDSDLLAVAALRTNAEALRYAAEQLTLEAIKSQQCAISSDGRPMPSLATGGASAASLQAAVIPATTPFAFEGSGTAAVVEAMLGKAATCERASPPSTTTLVHASRRPRPCHLSAAALNAVARAEFEEFKASLCPHGPRVCEDAQCAVEWIGHDMICGSINPSNAEVPPEYSWSQWSIKADDHSDASTKAYHSAAAGAHSEALRGMRAAASELPTMVCVDGALARDYTTKAEGADPPPPEADSRSADDTYADVDGVEPPHIHEPTYPRVEEEPTCHLNSDGSVTDLTATDTSSWGEHPDEEHKKRGR